MRAQKLDNLGVSAFCESMAMMMKSGIQTDEAIGLLQHQNGAGKKKAGVLDEALSVMKREIDEGTGLAKAMETSGVFPKYALDMVAAGETSGHLEDILFRLSRYYADQKVISDKLKNAVTYPAAMLVLIIAVLAVMIFAVLPSFRGVYDNMTGSLASSAYSYINAANILCIVALVVMALVALALIIGAILWRTGHKKVVEAVLWKIPITAAILESLGMFRFTGALSTFLASGDMQDEAVLKSLPMTDCKPVEDKVRAMIREMEEGHSISQAAYDVELFEPVYGRMLLAGERSGNLENVLQLLTVHLEDNCSNLVDRLVGVVDPVLSGILMATVGLSLLSVMLPLIGMMNSVG